MEKETKELIIAGKRYSIGFPTHDQFNCIALFRIQVLNGEIDKVNEFRNVAVSAIAVFQVMLPELKNNLRVDELSNLSLELMTELVLVYIAHYKSDYEDFIENSGYVIKRPNLVEFSEEEKAIFAISEMSHQLANFINKRKLNNVVNDALAILMKKGINVQEDTIQLKIFDKIYQCPMPVAGDHFLISTMKSETLKASLLSGDHSDDQWAIGDLITSAISTFEVLLPELKVDLELTWLINLNLPNLIKLTLVYINDYKPAYDELVRTLYLKDEKLSIDQAKEKLSFIHD